MVEPVVPRAGSLPVPRLPVTGEGQARYGKGVGAGTGPAQISERLAAALAPMFADFAAVHLVVRPSSSGEPARMRRLAVHANERAVRYLDSMPLDGVVRWTEPSSALTALMSGESVHIPCLDAANADHLAGQLGAPGLAGVLHSASLLLLPLRAAERLTGFVLMLSGPDRTPCQAGEIPALEELARWAAEQLDGVRRIDRDLLLAGALQEAAGPRAPGPLPGVEVAYRYLPRRGDGLGGDWLDTLPLPGGRTALVIGDVEGHGPRAAVRMSQCQSMLRALAGLDLPPEGLLDRLDQLVRDMGEEQSLAGRPLVTCAYVVYDPSTGRCRIANAGHVPAVLVHPGGRAEVLRPPAGAPLGVGGVQFGALSFTVSDGSLLALYTDGLVDGGRDLDKGIRILAAQLGGPPRALEDACDAVLAALGPDERRDDATLLLARLAAPAANVASPASPASIARAARPAVREVTGGIRLPPDETSFAGRDLEVEDIRRLLRTVRLVTLTGVAGVGKSRLARRTAALLGAEFPDGIRLVRLGTVRTADQIPHAVNEALDIESRTSLPDLEDKRTLLVLDDCEHLAAGCAAFARSLLRAAPGLRVLVTSRQALRVAGEHTLAVPPLPEDAAVTLFAERVAARGVHLTGEDAGAVRELCGRMDGLPLAVELAALRLDGSLEDLLARLDDRFGLLTSDGPTFPPHHESLRAAIGRSHELCEPLERLLWARLSVFTGTFELADAELVCADLAIPAADVLAVLSGLVTKSVVVRVEGNAYLLPSLLREYGAEHLTRLDGPSG